MKTHKTFLGNGWCFPPAVHQDFKQTSMVAYEEAVRQSLWMLLSTSPGERVHRYDYGCSIKRYMFEIMNIATQTLLRDEIERAVVMFEPRVDLNQVNFEVDEASGILKICLDYTIRKTNRRTNMVYPFYLNEGTDLVELP